MKCEICYKDKTPRETDIVLKSIDNKGVIVEHTEHLKTETYSCNCPITMFELMMYVRSNNLKLNKTTWEILREEKQKKISWITNMTRKMKFKDYSEHMDYGNRLFQNNISVIKSKDGYTNDMQKEVIAIHNKMWASIYGLKELTETTT